MLENESGTEKELTCILRFYKENNYLCIIEIHYEIYYEYYYVLTDEVLYD